MLFFFLLVNQYESLFNIYVLVYCWLRPCGLQKCYWFLMHIIPTGNSSSVYPFLYPMTPNPFTLNPCTPILKCFNNFFYYIIIEPLLLFSAISNIQRVKLFYYFLNLKQFFIWRFWRGRIRRRNMVERTPAHLSS